VPEGAKLYVFSDGAFEIATPAGMGTLEDFVSLLTTTDLEPPPEPPALLERSRARVLDTQFDDDFSVMAFTFS
jgi:serine phosphatase RsbU (regulator of sigma subunit)